MTVCVLQLLTYTEPLDDFVNISDIHSEILGAFSSIDEAERHKQLVEFMLKKIKDLNTKYIFKISPVYINEPSYQLILDRYITRYHPEISNNTYPTHTEEAFNAVYDDITNP